MNKIHIHLTLTIQEANWFLKLLIGTEAETAWGQFFHRIGNQVECNITSYYGKAKENMGNIYAKKHSSKT